MVDRIYRSRRDRVLAGVAGGLAERYGADVSVIRVAWVILAFVSGGLFALVYLVMALVVPEAPEGMPATPPTGGAWQGPSDSTGGAWTPGAGSWSPAPTPRSPDAGRNTSIAIGIGLILLGAWFLLDRYLAIRIDWDLVWPVIVIGLGAVLIAAAIRRGAGSRPG
ncbi:MAG TPA: PspC domain-containing protein [Candidatus Limnocylindrales bacterium]|nr:PspC domain-containing protein [Candidatus Limnocylindrales bacterium]